MKMGMEYITYRRFQGRGLGGRMNLAYGTLVEERGGVLFTQDGRPICAVASENGWSHFRPNTPEGAQRQAMLEALYAYYEKNGFEDEMPARSALENRYWKNSLRTMDTPTLAERCLHHLGRIPQAGEKQK